MQREMINVCKAVKQFFGIVMLCKCLLKKIKMEAELQWDGIRETSEEISEVGTRLAMLEARKEIGWPAMQAGCGGQ